MYRYLSDKQLSTEAINVQLEGKKIWCAFYEHKDISSVREELKLNRPDVGWYQIRKAIQSRNESGDFAPVTFKNFESTYAILSDKIRPMVYELGFLKL